MSSVDHTFRDRWISETEDRRKQRGTRDGGPPAGPPGPPPDDPGLPARVATLEAGQHRLELAAARIEATLATLATRADLVKVEGALNTLDAKVTALDGRISRVEESVKTALTTAINKAIGPVQFVAMLAGAVVLFGAAVAAYRWLQHQPWFA